MGNPAKEAAKELTDTFKRLSEEGVASGYIEEVESVKLSVWAQKEKPKEISSEVLRGKERISLSFVRATLEVFQKGKNPEEGQTILTSSVILDDSYLQELQECTQEIESEILQNLGRI